jgi:hypothetical protein
MIVFLASLLFQAPIAAHQAWKLKVVPLARSELITPFPVHLVSVGPGESREARFGIRSLHDRPFRFQGLDASLGATLDETQLVESWKPGEELAVSIKVDPSGPEGRIKGRWALARTIQPSPTTSFASTWWFGLKWLWTVNEGTG